MGLWDFLLLLLVAAIIGAIGEAIGGFSPGGCALSIVVGFVGAIIGTWLRVQLKLPEWITVSVGGTKFPIIWAIIGAALLVTVLRLIMTRRAVT